VRRILLALLTTCLLCACGQKGALYIPGEEREVVTPATPETAATTPLTDEERARQNAARTTPAN
jgi:predicted small lipoprotein YifL